METTISIPENNLYAYGQLFEFEDGEQLLTREPIEYEAREDDSYHTVKEGENLQLIAYNKWKNDVKDAAKYWWVIADVNEIITEPWDISSLIGSEILIPDINRVKLQLEM